MHTEELLKLNQKFSDESQEMIGEFIELFNKWKKRSFRLTIIMAMHLPINIIINMMAVDSDNAMPRLFEDFPEMFERFLHPFSKIKEKWGQISSKEFANLYVQEYRQQFKSFFVSEVEKKEFKEWYSQNIKKHKRKK